MGELAGIMGIISAFAVAVDLFLGFYIWWQYLKLNEVLSIYVWAADMVFIHPCMIGKTITMVN